jgi:hypothetical protein
LDTGSLQHYKSKDTVQIVVEAETAVLGAESKLREAGTAADTVVDTLADSENYIQAVRIQDAAEDISDSETENTNSSVLILVDLSIEAPGWEAGRYELEYGEYLLLIHQMLGQMVHFETD